MKIKNFFKSLLPPKEAKHCTAIIVAGGSGTRMGTGTTKQMMTLGGMPVVARTISVFESCDKIKSIIIVAKKEEIPCYADFIKQYGFKKIRKVVAGGDTRQKSVLCGFKCIDEKCDFVAIHDAARALITKENITQVLENAERHSAASAACPVKDTIKITDYNGFVVSTPDRTKLWAAQTPQIFKTDLYRAAAFYALEKSFEGTDDNSLVEWLGCKVKMVDCGYENLKLTTPEDMYLAQMILKQRGSVN